DGKIIIGGDFTTYSGTTRNRIARINADGTLDASFNPGTGASGTVYSTAVQSDGKIIIEGSFTSYNGTGRNRIARVIGGDLTTLTVNLKVYIEGFYIAGTDFMQAVIDPVNLPTVCDTVTLSLADSATLQI